MRSRKLSAKFAAALLALASLCVAASAQKLPRPRQEKLLNGLRLLMWPDEKADKVWVRVRVHSGSAFDPQGKEGTMRLLADSFFPNENAREFFTEDLGGSLQVVTTYDYIQIDASARPDQFLTLLETVATAVSDPTIDKETTAKVRSALIERLKKLQDDSQYVADRAVAERLLGDFPYGRPLYGTADSLPRIDFADLIGVRQRFLTADNATVAISGNFDDTLAFRAVRRYFGSWLKSDRTVPSTFRQPDEPAITMVRLPSPNAGGAAARFALRGVARAGRDLAASMVFTKLVQERLRKSLGGEGPIDVRNEFRTLPGLIVISVPPTLDSKGVASVTPEARRAVIRAVGDTATDAEFQAARDEAAAEWSKRDPVTFWLDADTYKIENVDADAHVLDTVTLAGLNAYIQKAKDQPMVSIVISAQPAKP
jgi:hypothetical protein